MCNDSVLNRVLNVVHIAKCFSPCVYNNFIPSQKCQIMGRMIIKKRGRAPGLIENKASLRLICKLS